MKNYTVLQREPTTGSELMLVLKKPSEKQFLHRLESHVIAVYICVRLLLGHDHPPSSPT